MRKIGIINRVDGDKWIGPLPAYVNKAELPSLLTALEQKAAEAEISTAQAELVAACIALRDEYFNLVIFLRMHHMQIANDVLLMVQQALARAQQHTPDTAGTPCEKN